MKKLFLLSLAGFTIAAANAQTNESIVLTNAKRTVPGHAAVKHVGLPGRSASATAAKTTSNPEECFSFQDAASAAPAGNLFPIYNDTTLLVPNGNPAPFNWYIQGLGTSFDPTSVKFSSAGFANPASMYPQPTFIVKATNPYRVDSFTIAGRYVRLPYNNYVDTLNIYIAATPAAGTTTLTTQSSSYTVDTLAIPDGILHLASFSYDSSSNSITTADVPSVIKITKILDSAAALEFTVDANNDTLSFFTFTIPNGLSVAAGGKVVAYQQFISGHDYGFDYSLDSANTWQVLTEELNGAGSFPSQLQNDYNSGLIMTGQSRYDVNEQGVILSGGQFITSTYLYGASGFEDPFFGFYLNCSTCFLESVANVKTITGSAAYPNPATSEINIPFTLSQNTSATVTLVNTLGQTVNTQSFSNVTSGKAVFNTSSLAAGVYFYTIEANGERMTGRFVAAHS